MSPNEPSVQTVRRRVWYCLYILDQLVALQLSRPPAIRQGDFNVSLPARSDDVPSSDQTGTTTEKDPWIGDYFVSMIQFSHIIGQVLRNLYSPMGALLNEATLSTIERFDQTLLEWKLNLPRSLRFDLGHTFEKSVTFRRQVGLDLVPSVPVMLTHAEEYARYQVLQSSRSHTSSLSVPFNRRYQSRSKVLPSF